MGDWSTETSAFDFSVLRSSTTTDQKAHQTFEETTMCRRDYRQHRCNPNHRTYAKIDYCKNATTNRQGQRVMCSRATSNRITVATSSGNLCGSLQCYLNDLKAKGWTCCECGEENNRMDGCLGPPDDDDEDCSHFVCNQCEYS